MRISLLIALIFCFQNAIGQIVTIPDPDFKMRLVNHSNPVIDTNGDGEIQVSEAEATIRIGMSPTNIYDLTGIEAFINLEELAIQRFFFTSVDLSQNTQLKELFLTIGELENIELPNSINMERIDIWSNSLTELDLSNFPNLNHISIGGNNISSIDISNNLALTTINISKNPITSLDVSGQLGLELLFINDTSIADIDLTNNSNLINFAVGNIDSVSPITSLDLSNNTNLEILRVNQINTNSLDITANTNLTSLTLRQVPFSSVDITNNVLLQYLRVDDGENISSLDLSQNDQLTELVIYQTQITNLDLNQNTSLERLTLREVPINNLDTSQNTLLTYLYLTGLTVSGIDLSQNTALDEITLWYNTFSTVDLSNIVALSDLTIGGPDLTSITYPSNNYLLAVWFYYTSFESLDFSFLNSLCRVHLRYNMLLTSLNVRNGNTAALQSGSNCGNSISGLSVRHNPNLYFICVDDAQFAADNLPFISPWITYVEDCTITGSDLNQIEGTISFDANGNDCGSGAIPLEGIIVNTTDGTHNFASASEPSGDYNLNVSENTYTTSVVGLPSYFSVTPNEAVDTFVGFGQTEQQDFCIQAATVANDLNVSINPQFSSVPGGFGEYNIVYQNAGTTPLNGEVTMNFDASKMSFVFSDPDPTSQTGSSVTWDLGTLGVLTTGVIEVGFSIADAPINEPGDDLVLSASIEPIAGDETPGDNVFTIVDVVELTPYNENLTVVQGPEVHIDNATDYLNYVINFQNDTGEEISNVLVNTILDANLDSNSIQIISSSHPVRFNMYDGEINFWFDGINLPAFDGLQVGGEGYVMYRVKPVNGVDVGDIVTSSSSIHMDLNAPIFTNDVTTTFVDVLEIGEFNFSELEVIVFPNPARNEIRIESSSLLSSIEVYSMLGQKLLETKTGGTSKTIEISTLTVGNYLVKVNLEGGGTKTLRLLKE